METRKRQRGRYNEFLDFRHRPMPIGTPNIIQPELAVPEVPRRSTYRRQQGRKQFSLNIEEQVIMADNSLVTDDAAESMDDSQSLFSGQENETTDSSSTESESDPLSAEEPEPDLMSPDESDHWSSTDDGAEPNNVSFTDESEHEDNHDFLAPDIFKLLEDGNLPLYEGSRISKTEAIISIIAFSLRFHLSNTCLEKLLQLFKLFMPIGTDIPGSKYLFFKTLSKSIDDSYQMHYYCFSCKNYLGQHPVEQSPCDSCNHQFQHSESMENGSFFLYMPLAAQLKGKYEHSDYNKLINNYKFTCEKTNNPNILSDIVSGVMYNQLVNHDDNETSGHWHVDGLSIFKSSNYSIWPIQYVLNELPPSERKNNILLTGLWFGRKKPEMQECFLKPFVEEMKELETNGFTWLNKATGERCTTKLKTILNTADAPARALAQNVVQYNGKFGCSVCYHPGKRIVRGRGSSRIYSYKSQLEMRTVAQNLEHARLALQVRKPVKGIKGPSTLMYLATTFDMTKSFSPDYMHSAIRGVCRQFVNLWLTSSQEEYYLRPARVEEINQLIVSLKATNEVTRNLRTTTDFKYWKASELRTFLIGSPLFLEKVLKQPYYKHWLLFVFGINKLLGCNITQDDVGLADKALKKFVRQIKDLYCEGELTYNTHMLLHFPQAVIDWGPLWAHSAFTFESNLGKVKQLFHGTKGVPQQIMISYLHSHLVEKSVNTLGPPAEKFVSEMRRGYAETKKCVKVDAVSCFGKPTQRLLTNEECNIIKDIIRNTGDETAVTGKFFKRASHNHVLLTTAEYCREKRNVDCYVSVEGKLVEVTNIVLVHGKVIFLGVNVRASPLKKRDPGVGQLCAHILRVNGKSRRLMAFLPSMIYTKYMMLIKGEISYVIPLPNLVERD